MDQVILLMLSTGVVAVILGIILKRFDVPPIVGYILSGIILVNIIGNDGQNSHTLEQIAEFGIVFLMFTIGLEMKLENLMQMRKQVFAYGGLQVGLSMLFFTLVSHFLIGLDIKASIVIGGALSLSSTAIVLKILNDTNNITKQYGQNSLGMLIFQDLAVIPILLVMTILSNSQSNISTLLVDIVFSAIILLIVMLIFGKYFLDHILKLVNKADTHELFIMIVLIIAIGASYVAHYLGFTYSMGAFIGGMLIAETHYKHQVEADLIPFRDLFLALFFVTVGMQIDIQFFITHLGAVFGLSFIIMTFKALIIFGFMYFFVGKRVALETSLVISQVGEFSFVVFTQATQTKLLDASTGQLLTLAVIISMVITPFLLKNIEHISNKLLKRTDIKSEVLNVDKHSLQNHIIVCGYGSFGKQILLNLKKQNIEHITIIDNYEFFENALSHGEKVLFGNPVQKHILQEAGIAKAKAVIIALHDIESIELLSHTIKELNSQVKILAKVTKISALPETIDSENFVDIYDCTAELLVEKAR
ncbi:MAG: cation:proton antiporter [Arcobacteraceae bacterium]|nr:cation:proton antiporter [Arcobacteraceae bacterium]